jgi:hypothetical protein
MPVSGLKKRSAYNRGRQDVSGAFQFNHIRYDYKYDWLLCLGIAPAEILFDVWSKADVATGKAGSMVTMGRGQNSSFKLTKKKSVLKPISKFKGADNRTYTRDKLIFRKTTLTVAPVTGRPVAMPRKKDPEKFPAPRLGVNALAFSARRYPCIPVFHGG